MQVKLYRDYYKSPAGVLEITASENCLEAVVYAKRKKLPVKKNKITREAVNQLKKYFTGKLKSFNLPLNIVGTPFQKEVWAKTAKIGYGKTLSYKDIAELLGNRHKARAVGNALNKNRHAIVIPCHRVLASNGKMGGYAAGVDNKISLLNLEKH